MVVLTMITTLLAILVTLLLLKLVYDTLSCYWLTPLRIKRIMEMQGVRGPKPRCFTGNIMDMASLVSKTTSHDMNTISHDIVGRLLPHFLLWSSQFGTYIYIQTYIFSFFVSSVHVWKLIPSSRVEPFRQQNSTMRDLRLLYLLGLDLNPKPLFTCIHADN